MASEVERHFEQCIDICDPLNITEQELAQLQSRVEVPSGNEPFVDFSMNSKISKQTSILIANSPMNEMKEIIIFKD